VCYCRRRPEGLHYISGGSRVGQLGRKTAIARFEFEVDGGADRGLGCWRGEKEGIYR
jgi:hypothetical protein